MISVSQARTARKLLEKDRLWAAYALADLEPPFAQDARWFIGRRALVLMYHGLHPPVLFATGDLRELNRLAGGLPAGRYAYTLKPDALAAFGARINIESRLAMWRMALSAGEYRPARDERTRPLGPGDLAAIKRFMECMDEAPDAFSPQQLESGVFFGVFEGEELLSMAGTHVVAPGSGIAAIGNVATLPQARRLGLARAASAAVIEALLERGIHTLVLNVAQENRAALRLYQDLGFCIHCGYDEGVATLNPETIARSDP
jgi:ribosomal protein S18 acetylase RimI-like enzyme